MFYAMFKNPLYLFKKPFTAWYKISFWLFVLFCICPIYCIITSTPADIAAKHYVVILFFYIIIMPFIGCKSKVTNSKRYVAIEKEKEELHSKLLNSNKKIMKANLEIKIQNEEKLKRQTEAENTQKIKELCIIINEINLINKQKEQIMLENRIKHLNKQVQSRLITDSELTELAKYRVATLKKEEELKNYNLLQLEKILKATLQQQQEIFKSTRENSSGVGYCPCCKRNTLQAMSITSGGGYSFFKGLIGGVLGDLVDPFTSMLGFASGIKEEKTKIIYVCPKCGYKTYKI